MSAAAQDWSAASYARNAAFVPAMGAPVVELLDPRPGERILDLGCGDGVLTERLVAAGATVLGVDGSPDMVAAVRARGLDGVIGDGQALGFDAAFDAAFSNAALHWMQDAAAVASGVFRALRPGGRFVGEMGGAGNVRAIWDAVEFELAVRGLAVPAAYRHWYPTVEAFASVYAAAGFADIDARLIDRPTPLPTGVAGWIATFFPGAFAAIGLDPAEQEAIGAAVERRLAPTLRQPDGGWLAPYVRLRFSMRKPV